MTNPIGTGTATKGINAPTDWWLEIGRRACEAGISVSEYVRRLTERGAQVENPVLAQKLSEARRRYYGAALLALFLGSLAWGAPDLRRPSRTVRVVRTQRRMEEA